MIDDDAKAWTAAGLGYPGARSDPFAVAVRLTSMPMVITDPRLPDNPIVFANPAFTALTGYGLEEILGRNCRFLRAPGAESAELDRLRTAIREQRSITVDLHNVRKDGTAFWNRLMVAPVFGDDGALTFYVASQTDVTLEREHLVQLEQDRLDLEAEVVRRRAELAASEDRLSFALKAGEMGSWTLDLETGRLTASEGCKANFGRAADEPFTYDDLMAAVHPEDRDRRNAAVEAAIATGSLLDVEYRLRTPTGEIRWVQIRGQASYGADSVPRVMVGVSQDITERKRIDEHRDLLADELSHRVKNSLTMVQAIVAQTLRKAASLQDAGDVLQSRIAAMAGANDLLTTERWQGADLRSLIERALKPFAQDNGEGFRLCGPDLQAPPRVATSLALVLHELATNASKYGALSVPGGEVRLDWAVETADGLLQLHLTWKEIGGPAVSPPVRTGFGTRLVDRVLTGDVGGRTRLDYQPDGLRLYAVIPLQA